MVLPYVEDGWLGDRGGFGRNLLEQGDRKGDRELDDEIW